MFQPRAAHNNQLNGAERSGGRGNRKLASRLSLSLSLSLSERETTRETKRAGSKEPPAWDGRGWEGRGGEGMGGDQ